MIILLLQSIALFYTQSAFAQPWHGVSDCGTYTVKGVVRSTGKGPLIKINEGTTSELSIVVPVTNETTLAPYQEKAVEAIVELDSRPSRTILNGMVSKINLRVPDHLNPNDTGILILSKKECKKL